MIIRQRILVAIMSSLFLVALNTDAYVGGTDLESLCAKSDIIAVVKVPLVHSTNRVNIAEASIEQMLKGDKKVKKVYFLASSTWTCDISRANQGESALVFLNKIDDRTKVHGENWKLPMADYGPLYRIGHVGRGRMPIHEKDEVKYAEVYIGDVKISQDIEKFPSRRVPQYDFIADLRLNEFIRLIEQEIAEPTVGYYARQRAKRAQLKIPHFTVSGAVKSPAQFELREGMTLREAINLAGGFEIGAEALTLYRKGGGAVYYINPCSAFDLSYAPPLKDGDRIDVKMADKDPL